MKKIATKIYLQLHLQFTNLQFIYLYLTERYIQE